MKRVVAMLAAVPAALAASYLFLLLFGFELATPDRLARFPDGWRLHEVVVHAMAVLVAVSFARVFYMILMGRGRRNDDGPPAGH